MQYTEDGYAKSSIPEDSSARDSIESVPTHSLDILFSPILLLDLTAIVSSPISAPRNLQVPLSWIVVVLILVLVISVVVLYFARERERRRLRESESSADGIETQLASFRSQMSPHFIFNSLNAIQYYIDRSEIEKSEIYLSKFSAMIRMFLKYSQSQTISVDSEAKLIENYLFLEHFRFEGKLEYSVKVDPLVDRYAVYIPSMLVHPVVAYAVNHSIFESSKPCMLTVAFSVSDDQYIRVDVTDNGTGRFSQEDTGRLEFQDENNESYIIQHRIDALNGKTPKSVIYHAKDIFLGNEVVGSAVTLLLRRTEKEVKKDQLGYSFPLLSFLSEMIYKI